MAHFHYDLTDLGPLQIKLANNNINNSQGNSGKPSSKTRLYSISVTSNGKSWSVRRSYQDLVLLDRQVHRCTYDRRVSRLPKLQEKQEDNDENDQVGEIASYWFLSSVLLTSLVHRWRFCAML